MRRKLLSWGAAALLTAALSLHAIAAASAAPAPAAAPIPADPDAALKAGQWEAAAKAYAARKGANDAKLAAAASFFAETAANTQILPESTAKDLYLVTLKNGAVIRGKLDHDRSDANERTFVKNGGGNMIFSAKDIVKQTPIDQATRDREMRAELAEKRAAAKDGLALYLCGVKALECNLQDLAREWFYEAAMADADVRHTAREFLAANLFSQAVFARNLKKLPEANRKFNELREKYPDCAATKMIDQTLKEADAMAAAAAKRKEEAKRLAKMKQKEAAAARAEARRKRREANKDLADIEDEIENAANAGGASDTAKADGLAAKADKLMKEAGSGGSRDERNRNFKEAMAGFKEAAVEYQKALNKKFDANLDRKLSEVQQKIYWCRKMQTL